MESQAKIDEACRTAEEFAKLYYESVDRKRRLLPLYYLETAVLVWNGNGIHGKDAILKFIEDLPPSEHILTSLDAQPVAEIAVGSQLTFLIQVAGLVKFTDKISRPFHQSFMITAESEKWKIVSDCFRFQEPVD